MMQLNLRMKERKKERKKEIAFEWLQIRVMLIVQST